MDCTIKSTHERCYDIMTKEKYIHHIVHNKNKNTWFPLWKPCYNSWLKEFSSYNHILWDKDEINGLIEKNYPEYYDFYNCLPLDIMKYDVARLLILYHYGGIYADMDVFCYKNFEKYLNKKFMIVDVSNHSNKIDVKHNRHGIETFLMYSLKRNTFFKECVDFIRTRWDKNNHLLNYKTKNKYVQYITGPYAIQEVFYRYYSKENVFPQHMFSNHESYYSENLYTRHLSASVWCGWSDSTEEEKNKIYHTEKPWLTYSNFSFYKNYLPIISYT